MQGKQTLHLCMGSACHQLGGYRLRPMLEDLIRRYELQERIELKGAFCLERCEHGRSLKFEDRVLTGLTADNVADRFFAEVLPHVRKG
jgi:NADH:ubiquinone oxidoreductase subunit E